MSLSLFYCNPIERRKCWKIKEFIPTSRQLLHLLTLRCLGGSFSNSSLLCRPIAPEMANVYHCCVSFKMSFHKIVFMNIVAVPSMFSEVFGSFNVFDYRFIPKHISSSCELFYQMANLCWRNTIITNILVFSKDSLFIHNKNRNKFHLCFCNMFKRNIYQLFWVYFITMNDNRSISLMEQRISANKIDLLAVISNELNSNIVNHTVSLFWTS